MTLMQWREAVSHLFHPRHSNNHRPKVLHGHGFAMLAVLTAVALGGIQYAGWLPGRLGSVLGFASSITPGQLIERTNAQRAVLGLPAFTANAALSRAALAKGQNMMNEQYWAHTSPKGKQPWSFIREAGYSYQAAGENLARDFSNTDEMMGAWMASPTHRANIVNTKYKEIGVAVIDGTLQGVETTLVVQMFGTSKVLPAVLGDAGETVVAVEQAPVPAAVKSEPETTPLPEVMSGALVPQGSLTLPPLFTPLQLSKAIVLAVVFMLVTVLVYDSFIVGHLRIARLVGKNIAHVMFLGFVAFLVILFKGGLVG
jgi:hypothetical protein